eukprot:4289395-Ditylum_brightwellii.AAC.1
MHPLNQLKNKKLITMKRIRKMYLKKKKMQNTSPPKHLKKEIACVEECVGLLQHQRNDSRVRDWRRENKS